MCGRYAITLPPEQFRELFGYSEKPNFPQRYNIAPTQPVPIVRHHEGHSHFALVRWAFMPGFIKDPQKFPLIINARAETLMEKPAFRGALKYRRCLFPVDGFYEWKKEGKAKQPFLIRRKDQGPFAFAGLWETWRDPEGGEIETAAIVTTQANATLQPIHDRMPVILEQDAFEPWLDVKAVKPEQAIRLLKPASDDLLETIPISTRINRVGHDDADVQTPNPA